MTMTKESNSDTQQRYTIDQGSSKKRKILPEEQHRVLQKLISAGSHALDQEERELINKLLDRLSQETDRVHNLQKVTVKDKPLDAFLEAGNKKKAKLGSNSHTSNHLNGESEENVTDDFEDEPPAPTIKRIVGFSPDEVVKHYLGCFNQQKFSSEYDCFSRDFMLTEREVYITMRQKYYQQQLQMGGMKIECEEIVSSDVVGDMAQVVARKIIKQNSKKPVIETDLYHLKLQNGRWLITGVEPQDH